MKSGAFCGIAKDRAIPNRISLPMDSNESESGANPCVIVGATPPPCYDVPQPFRLLLQNLPTEVLDERSTLHDRYRPGTWHVSVRYVAGACRGKFLASQGLQEGLFCEWQTYREIQTQSLAEFRKMKSDVTEKPPHSIKRY
jgi:hypothetical protein